MTSKSKYPSFEKIGVTHIDDYRKQLQTKAITITIISHDSKLPANDESHKFNEYVVGYDNIPDVPTQIMNFINLASEWILTQPWIPVDNSKFYQKKKDAFFNLDMTVVDLTLKPGTNVVNYLFQVSDTNRVNFVKIMFKVYNSNFNELMIIHLILSGLGGMYNVLESKETFYDEINKGVYLEEINAGINKEVISYYDKEKKIIRSIFILDRNNELTVKAYCHSEIGRRGNTSSNLDDYLLGVAYFDKDGYRYKYYEP